MTDIANLDDDTFVEMSQPTTKAIQRLEMEARAMKTAFQLASSLSKTSMVPEHFQQAYTGTFQKPHPPLGEVAAYNLAAAILYGAEIGLTAVQSAQNVFVVKGKPAVYARVMAAQVRAAGYQIEEVSAAPDAVVWKALRDGEWAYAEWTIGRAQVAGYVTNKLYQTNPIEMLRSKCIAEICRIKFQDVLLGMNYSVEELQLMDNVVVSRPVRKQGAKGVTSLRELAETADLKEAPTNFDPGGDTPPEPEATPDEPAESTAKAKGPQLTKIRALLKEQGIVGKDALAEVNLLIDKQYPDMADLSEEEASFVANALQGPVEE